MKKDKIFTHVILYTYSIIGNTPISNESKMFLLGKVEKDIVENEVNKDNLITLSLSAHSIYMDVIYNNVKTLPEKYKQNSGV